MALVSGISLDPEAAIGVTKRLPPKWTEGVDEVSPHRVCGCVCVCVCVCVCGCGLSCGYVGIRLCTALFKITCLLFLSISLQKCITCNMDSSINVDTFSGQERVSVYVRERAWGRARERERTWGRESEREKIWRA